MFVHSIVLHCLFLCRLCAYLLHSIWFLQMMSQYVRAVENQRMRMRTSGMDVTTAGGGIITTALALEESPHQRLH